MKTNTIFKIQKPFNRPLERSFSDPKSAKVDFVKSKFIIIFFSILGVSSLFAKQSKPNIVFILADDIGWADTTPYGSAFHETPNIARLAQRGRTFMNFHTTSPVCSPARASLMTGLYAERLGMTQPACHIKQVCLKAFLPESEWPDKKVKAPRSTTRLDTIFPTYAKVLQANGYRTGHFGKWHLGPEPYSPLEHGFDVDVPHTKSHGPIGSYFGPTKYSETFTLKSGEHLEDRMAQEAIKFIHKNKERPFLLNYWAFSVHTPMFGKKELLKKYRKKGAKLPADAEQRNPIYGAMIETFDTNVGLLLDAIDEAGIADNTIIVFSSDNGGTIKSNYTRDAYWGNGTVEEIVDIPVTSNAPLKGAKGTIHDGGTAVPCIVAWPGKIDEGSSSDAYFSGTDIFPTFVEMAGVSMPEGVLIDGVSQVSAIVGEGKVRDTLYGYWPNYFVKRNGSIPSGWIRRGDYKLVCFFFDGPNKKHRYSLYNLKKDIGESTDIATQYPKKVRELARLLAKHFNDCQTVLPVLNPAYEANAVSISTK